MRLKNKMSSQEIKQLPIEISNLIAAGEVVERPASVIKELVENSIDANATKIKIELTASGLKKMVVTDNGIGMSKDQIPIAILPHATSKIHTKADLFNITSLGFRGEALPSIASVSIMKITSSTDGTSAYYYEFKEAKTINQGITSLPKGTKVEVSNLFFNTPARYKHLGSEALELSHISMIINRLAIANPNIAFTLINNDKIIYQTDGAMEMLSIIASTYGKEVARHTLSFSNSNDFYKINGYTTDNNVFRSNKNAINIIINNRIIRNLNMLFAVTDAYKSIIPIGKYPITILEIFCDPSLVDVNVHPSKLEIRFTDEGSLRSLITKTIYDLLHHTSLVYDATASDFKNKQPNNITTINNFQENNLNKKEIKIEEVKKQDIDELWNMFDEEKKPFPATEDGLDSSNDDSLLKDEPTEVTNFDNFGINEEPIVKPSVAIQDKLISDNEKKFSNLRYIGQYHMTYLLLEDDKDLFLIDQHAAMERCMYEKIKKALLNKSFSTYELLVPLKLDFSVADMPLIMSKKNDLQELGFVIEDFGGSTILVRDIPNWVPKDLEVEFTSDVINHLIHDQKADIDVMYDSLAKSLACKKSIKANMHILESEVKSLLENLDACKMPYTCPHGRPTLVKLTTYEIEKLFKRVI